MTDPETDSQAPKKRRNRLLGGRLRELRARAGMTQEQVAMRVKCNVSAVSRWESGQRFPTADDLVSLAMLFRVSVDHLLGVTEQFAAPGSVLLDQGLLDRLEAAQTTEEFDRLIDENPRQAVWIPLPENSVLLPLAEAMRRTRKVSERHKDSKFADRLFRPGL